MSEAEPRALAAERAEFFRRTRYAVAGLYVTLALAAAGLGAYALSKDPGAAGLGIALGIAGMLLLLLVGVLFPTSTRTARTAIVVLVPISVIAVILFDDRFEPLASSALALGAIAGTMGGSAVGVALIRRRLAVDDQMWRRQKELGFDPERPFARVRGATNADERRGGERGR
jgi:hypothetical protein